MHQKLPFPWRQQGHYFTHVHLHTNLQKVSNQLTLLVFVYYHAETVPEFSATFLQFIFFVICIIKNTFQTASKLPWLPDLVMFNTKATILYLSDQKLLEKTISRISKESGSKSCWPTATMQSLEEAPGED